MIARILIVMILASAGYAGDTRKESEIVFDGESYLDGFRLHFYSVTLKDCRAAPKWDPDKGTAPPLNVYQAMLKARAHLARHVKDISLYTFNDFKLEMLESELSGKATDSNKVDQYWGWIITFTSNAPRTGSGLPPSPEIVVLMNGYCPPYVEQLQKAEQDAAGNPLPL